MVGLLKRSRKYCLKKGQRLSLTVGSQPLLDSSSLEAYPLQCTETRMQFTVLIYL
jgi:hypothetical protein